MNLNLISFPSVHPFQNSNFYPKTEAESCSLIVFIDENTPIKIKYPEMMAETVPHFSKAELLTFKKSNLLLLQHPTKF